MSESFRITGLRGTIPQMDRDKLRGLTDIAGVFIGGFGTAVGSMTAVRDLHNGRPIDAAITAAVTAVCVVGTCYAVGEVERAEQDENQE